MSEEKGKKRGIKETGVSILRLLKNRITNLDASVNDIRTDFETVIEEMKSRAHKITESLFSRILTLFLIMLGLIFLFLGTAYKLRESGLNNSDSFLIMGILIVILGWVFSILHRR